MWLKIYVKIREWHRQWQYLLFCREAWWQPRQVWLLSFDRIKFPGTFFLCFSCFLHLLFLIPITMRNKLEIMWVLFWCYWDDILNVLKIIFIERFSTHFGIILFDLGKLKECESFGLLTFYIKCMGGIRRTESLIKIRISLNYFLVFLDLHIYLYFWYCGNEVHRSFIFSKLLNLDNLLIKRVNN